jgi:hypothetical protein
VVDGTLTVLVTVVIPPLLVVSVKVTVSEPDELGIGTVAVTTVVPPLLVVSTVETVTAGTEKTCPFEPVTVTDGW